MDRVAKSAGNGQETKIAEGGCHRCAPPPGRWLRGITGAVAAWGLLGFGFFAGMVVTLTFAARELELAPLPIHASATQGIDSFIIATGLIDNGLEGVFFLDTVTGDLQCLVFNPRAGVFNTIFSRNVVADLRLAQEKTPEFLLVTGEMALNRLPGLAGQSGGCVAYLVEAHSGKFAAYAVPWRNDLFSRGQPQRSELVLLQTGSVRAAANESKPR